jgi:hypothetical protein
MRSWLFAEAIARMKEMDYDREVVTIGTVLHTSVSPPVCQGQSLRGEWRR